MVLHINGAILYVQNAVFLNYVHGKVSIFYIQYTVLIYTCVLYSRN